MVRWWQWPHVLSLEAPVVAVLWLLGLAKIHDLRLLPGTASGLALCVWTIYVLDRTLDTLGRPVESLDERHAVYSRFRKVLLGLVIPAALLVLGWMALTVIPAMLMWQCVALGMLVALYLAVYAAGEFRTVRVLLAYAASLGALTLISGLPVASGIKAGVAMVVLVIMVILLLRQINLRISWSVPKELAAGVLFALGCTTAIRFFGSEDQILAVLLETGLLTAMFTSNLAGIRVKEDEDSAAAMTGGHWHYGTLLACSGLLAVAALALAQVGRLPPRQWALSAAVLAALALLALLHSRRHQLSAAAYRSLADVAVAVPALWLLR